MVWDDWLASRIRPVSQRAPALHSWRPLWPAFAIITAMTRGVEARLFVALDLPPDVRARLVTWARGCASSARTAARAVSTARAERSPTNWRPAAPHSRLRLLDADMLHITLCFLGSRPVGEIEAIGDALAAACAEAPPMGELALGAPLWLPPRRPRALGVELHDDADGALRVLHHAVAEALAAACDLEPPATHAAGRGAAGKVRERRFRPHVTVARMRAGDAPHERGLPATPPLSFSPQSVTLYRSWLTPTEALYEGLSTHALATPGID
jgi:2'-5' RNA ligase